MKLLYATLIFILTGCSFLQIQKPGFDITFYNDTDNLACYLLQWHSHGFAQQSPASMCGGELDPGDVNIVENGYSPGLWEIHWYSCRNSNWSDSRMLIIDDDIHHLKTTPSKDILK